MKKNIYSIEHFQYVFDNTLKGAKYSWDWNGRTYKGNNGEWVEAVQKWCLGFAPIKDASTPYNEGSDIEELGISVKSWGFTLASCIKTDTFEENLQIYFENVASYSVTFSFVIESELITYNMNMDEFKQFLYRFAKYDKYSRTVRGPRFSHSKMAEVTKWLDRQC